MGFAGERPHTQLLLAFFSANYPPSNKQLLQSGKQLPLNSSDVLGSRGMADQ